MKFIAGITSVTFRDKKIEEIAQLAKSNGLLAIEWGGDIHVPNKESAIVARKTTENLGLHVSSYGSYYCLGQNQDFDKILDCAKVLNAPIIRVWAGNKSPNAISEKEYEQVVFDCRAICEKAGKVNIKIGLECHHDTLTENRLSAVDFMSAVGNDNLYFYWQPNQFISFEENLLSAKDLSYKTIALHVFNWDKDNKYPLAEGKEKWRAYLNVFREKNIDLPILLEFMYDGKVEGLPNEARALIELIK